MSKNLKQFRFSKGTYCFVHALSPMLHNYWNTYGQPIDEDLYLTSAFEGKCIGEPSKKDMSWSIEIDALSRDGLRIFRADQEMIQDGRYVVRGLVEPDDWMIHDRPTMAKFFGRMASKNKAAMEGLSSKTTPRTPASNIPAFGPSSAPFMNAITIDPIISPMMARPLSVENTPLALASTGQESSLNSTAEEYEEVYGDCIDDTQLTHEDIFEP